MDDATWAALEQERLSLADLLDELSPGQWAASSLCARWRVRDVAAHVAMTPTAPTTPTLLRALVRARGDLWSAGRTSQSTTRGDPPGRSSRSCATMRRPGRCRGSPTPTTCSSTPWSTGRTSPSRSASRAPYHRRRRWPPSNGSGGWVGPPARRRLGGPATRGDRRRPQRRDRSGRRGRSAGTAAARHRPDRGRTSAPAGGRRRPGAGLTPPGRAQTASQRSPASTRAMVGEGSAPSSVAAAKSAARPSKSPWCAASRGRRRRR